MSLRQAQVHRQTLRQKQTSLGRQWETDPYSPVRTLCSCACWHFSVVWELADSDTLSLNPSEYIHQKRLFYATTKQQRHSGNLVLIKKKILVFNGIYVQVFPVILVSII